VPVVREGVAPATPRGVDGVDRDVVVVGWGAPGRRGLRLGVAPAGTASTAAGKNTKWLGMEVKVRILRGYATRSCKKGPPHARFRAPFQQKGKHNARNIANNKAFGKITHTRQREPTGQHPNNKTCECAPSEGPHSPIAPRLCRRVQSVRTPCGGDSGGDCAGGGWQRGRGQGRWGTLGDKGPKGLRGVPRNLHGRILHAAACATSKCKG
jgi:hypothetical protein